MTVRLAGRGRRYVSPGADPLAHLGRSSTLRMVPRAVAHTTSAPSLTAKTSQRQTAWLLVLLITVARAMMLSPTAGRR